jgi:hypothetical protein
VSYQGARAELKEKRTEGHADEERARSSKRSEPKGTLISDQSEKTERELLCNRAQTERTAAFLRNSKRARFVA